MTPPEKLEAAARALAKARHEALLPDGNHTSQWDEINESWRQEQTERATPEAQAALSAVGYDALVAENERLRERIEGMNDEATRWARRWARIENGPLIEDEAERADEAEAQLRQAQLLNATERGHTLREERLREDAQRERDEAVEALATELADTRHEANQAEARCDELEKALREALDGLESAHPEDAVPAARAALQPESKGAWSDWRCPDCGSGMTKVHIGIEGALPCGKPPGCWSAQPESKP